MGNLWVSASSSASAVAPERDNSGSGPIQPGGNCFTQTPSDGAPERVYNLTRRQVTGFRTLSRLTTVADQARCIRGVGKRRCLTTNFRRPARGGQTEYEFRE